MKEATTSAIDHCRVCSSNDLSELYSLGNLYISDFVEKPDDGIKAPLEMVMCNHCSLVQLRHTAPQELLYTRFYWYRSGVTDTMKKALRDITQSIERRIDLKAGDIVLDIGSNDGTMLRTYATEGLVTVGVEPASNLAEEGAKGLTHFINDFWTYDTYKKTVGKKAKVITAIGMFYDMEDPNQFIRDAASALENDGIFVAQLMCLKNMLDTNDVGNICHEHLEFYSLSALEFLFEKNGFELIDIEHNLVNGGSYRVFAGLKGGNAPSIPGAAERLKKFRAEEEAFASKQVHLDFFQRIEENRKACVDFIKGEVAKGKRVWVYGASTKGNTILQYYGLDHTLIEAASERSPEKWGKYTVGTMIPIVSEEEARKSNPDYFLVLPYAFFDEFYKREEAWRKGGGQFIVPLPTFRVVP
jgi:NDP-4-keto-2,6-dideoxyhexose 3-C-methyltransferase